MTSMKYTEQDYYTTKKNYWKFAVDGKFTKKYIEKFFVQKYYITMYLF